MRILIADGHPLFQDALAGVLKVLQPSADIAVVVDYPALQTSLGSERYQLVVADLTLPGLHGLADIVDIVNVADGSRVLAVTDGHPSDVHRQMRVCGVAGLVDKGASTEQIARVIAMVMRGGLAFPDIMAVPSATAIPQSQPELTTRQLQVLSSLAKGKSNKQIAKDLTLSPNTVKAHVSEILRKFGLAGRGEVIALANQPLATPTLLAAD